jgi:hypothetical protein
MTNLIDRHRDQIVGVLSCYDRQGFSEELGRPDVLHGERAEGATASTSSRPGQQAASVGEPEARSRADTNGKETHRGQDGAMDDSSAVRWSIRSRSSPYDR